MKQRIISRFSDPHFLRKFHGRATIVWGCLIIPTVLVWHSSILWVALMSAWANFATHWGAWQATRAEVGVIDDIAVRALLAENDHDLENLAAEVHQQRVEDVDNDYDVEALIVEVRQYKHAVEKLLRNVNKESAAKVIKRMSEE